jgi:hypothetical protein
MTEVEKTVAKAAAEGVTPDNIHLLLREFRDHYLGKDLWDFLDKFGKSTFEKFLSKGSEPTLEEIKIKDQLESAKQANESSNFSFGPILGRDNYYLGFNMTGSTEYYQELIRAADATIISIDNLRAKIKAKEESTVSNVAERSSSEDLKRTPNELIPEFKSIKKHTEKWLISYLVKEDPMYESMKTRYTIKTTCENIFNILRNSKYERLEILKNSLEDLRREILIFIEQLQSKVNDNTIFK